jgi:serine/threonine protein kinase
MNQGDENIRTSRDLQRAHGPQVTGIGRGPRIFPGGGQVTAPGQGILPGTVSGTRNTIGLMTGQRIENSTNGSSYVVESEEIVGNKGGQAQVICCRCTKTDEKVAIKFYPPLCKPNQKITDVLLKLRNQNVIKVLDLGKWQDKNNADIFYEVLEYCEGGSLFDLMPLTEDKITKYLSVIVNGLEYLHSFCNPSIVHRDIKPSNLLFRTTAHNPEDLVIADFGISSILAGDEEGDGRGLFTTMSTEQFTPDYVAPELGAGKIASFSDYYSLGMTLLHCLSPDKRPPMDYWSVSYQKINAHRTGTVLRLLMVADMNLRQDDISSSSKQEKSNVLRVLHDMLCDEPRLMLLFEGLLQVNPEYRWGSRQIRQWLDNQPITNDTGTEAWRGERYPGIEIPYNREILSSVKKPHNLVKYINNPSYSDTIFSDLETTLFHWVSKFSGELKDNVAKLYKEHQNNKDLALFKLKFILDPSLPLIIGLKSILTFDDFSRCILESDDEQSLIALEDGLWKEQIEAWIDAVHGNDLTVGTNKNETKGILSFLKRLRTGTNRNRRLAVWELRWYFFPKTIPFPFMNRRADNPQSLVNMIDRDEASQKEGFRLMNEGWIGAWLFHRFGENSPEFRDHNMQVAKNDNDRTKLEALLHILDVDLEWALPEAKPPYKKFGKIAFDSSKSVNIRFQNKNRGYWESDILLRTKSPRGFELSLSTVAQGGMVTLIARPGSLPVGKSHMAEIVVSYYDGQKRIELTVPVSFRVAAPVWKMAGRSILVGLGFGVVLGGLRYGMNYLNELNAFQTLGWMPWKKLSILNWKIVQHISEFEWLLIAAAVVLLGTVGFGLFRLWMQFKKVAIGKTREL